MEFSEIAFQSKILEKQKAERFKNQLTTAAFVGWQTYIMKGGKGTFSNYLNDLGLSDKKDKKLSKEERKSIAKHAYKTGERIMKLLEGKTL